MTSSLTNSVTQLKTSSLESVERLFNKTKLTKMKTLKQITTKKSPIKIWVGRIDEVFGDSMIAFGKSEKEVENLLFREYKEMGRTYNEHYKTTEHGRRTKSDFLEYHGAWIQPMEVGKAYIGDEDETPKG